MKHLFLVTSFEVEEAQSKQFIVFSWKALILPDLSPLWH